MYNLLLGGSWAESLEEELPFAYDFLCDLYFDTGREDVLRTAEFLGRCISSGVEAAAALEAEGSTVTPRLQDWLEIDEHIPYV